MLKVVGTVVWTDVVRVLARKVHRFADIVPVVDFFCENFII